MQASESPGGLYADATLPQFPSGTEADQDAWEYEMSQFKTTTVDPFDYESNKNAKESLVGHKDIMEEAKIASLKAEAEEWNKTNWP